ncbi:MAG: ATP-dependent helicase HrpB, partial [Mailhella sp.]|nr:ATP-dependent helicase HrpB [Mailhella sp.]
MTMPVDESIPQLLDALAADHRAVLTAPPGSGKTTRVPLHLMRHIRGTILMLEPRRIAARSAARYMASELGEKPGGRIGYRVRLESRVGRDTRVEIITEGILTRRLVDDPGLEGVGCVIFDEFHERSLHADTGLALCLEVQQALRPDLDILVMSATIDSDATASYMSPCRVIRAEGRMWPVDIRYDPLPGGNAAAPNRRRELCRHMAAVIRKALSVESGSLLAFLPGRAEIRMTAEELGAMPPSTDLFPLYGELSPAEQDAAIAPAAPGRRKVVLATSIAETSLTIEGIRIVVDSGLTRTSRVSAATGMSALVTENATQDAADQRAGRAGRLEPGVCIRIWPEGLPLLPSRRPEIAEADLAPFLLDMLAWGADPAGMDFMTPPPAPSLKRAEALLTDLGAVRTEGSIRSLTPLGRAMASMPMHPRLARMVLAAEGHGHLAAAIAALAEERPASRCCDMRTLLPELGRNSRLSAAAAQIYGLAEYPGRFSLREAMLDEASAGALISLAWPDRIARKRSRGKFLLASGRGAEMAEDDALAGEELLAVAAMDGGASGSGRIFLAAPLSSEELEELHGRGTEADTVEWDPRTEAVSARHTRSLGAIVLEEHPLSGGRAPAGAILSAVLQGIGDLGLDCLPWTQGLRRWQARTALLRPLE